MKGKKTGGRKPGTPNKDSAPLEEKAKALGIDPFEILLYFAAGDWKALGYDSEVYVKEDAKGSTTIGYTISPEMRCRAASEAAQYIYPKKKAVELSTADTGIKIIVEDYSKE